MILLGLEIILLGGGSLACSYWGALTVRGCVGDVVNQWLSAASEENRETALVLKSEFQDADVRPLRAVDNHTHGPSAAARSTATLLIRRTADGVGRKPYFLQGSGANARAGLDYSRSYFWTKDVMAPYKKFGPGERDIIAIVDVDYYIDMTELLVDQFQPYLMYTLVPSAAAKDVGDYGYCFSADGKVRYHVSGGGSYEHFLWDWDGDSLRVFKKRLGFEVAMACYAVERRQIDEDHQVILLVPMFKSSNPLSTWISKPWVDARTLKHFDPMVGGFVRFYTTKTGGREVVTGKPGEYTSCSLPARIDSAIASAAITMTGKLSLSTVKAKMNDGCTGDVKQFPGAEVLLEFHQKRQPTVAHVSLVDSVRRFQWVPKGAEPDTDAKPGMSAFMTPILDGGFVPDVCPANEQRFVDKRILEVRSKEMPIDSYMLKCMHEFAEFLVPENMKHTLHPVDEDEIYKRQNKPSQRAILNAADQGMRVPEVKSFMKREAYGSVNDPRGISTICGADKRDFSAFIYSFSDQILKPTPWYAFGKSPREVAERVAEIAQTALEVSNTDFSRMDGHHSNVLTFLEKLCYTRAFKPAYHNELVELINGLKRLPAKTIFGLRYETDEERISGVPDTSAANTLDTAFIAFYTYKQMGYIAVVAYNRLGLYGGDDGTSADMDPAVAKRAAARVGQVLDLERVRRGELGVKFLARRYGPDVWFGDTNSCCDIKRQLAKFHLTVNLPGNITAEKKLQEKAFSFYLTDANTPIIGEFVTKALELLPLPKSEFKNELGIWGVEMDAEKQYINRRADWMHSIIDTELPNFDVGGFRDWLAQCDSGTILNPPRVADPLPPNPKPGIVAVDGDLVITPDDRAPAEGSIEPNERKADGGPRFRPRQPKAERPSHKVKRRAKKHAKKSTTT